jgi:hypothetical protein
MARFPDPLSPDPDRFEDTPDRFEATSAPEPQEEVQKAPIEWWAEKKGLLPARAGVAENPDNWKFGAAKAFKGWAPGALVTEAEFDEAIEKQGQTVSR